MAHELETNNTAEGAVGGANMAYVGVEPWHGLGVKLDSGATPDQMMKAAGLDWTVSKQPIYTKHTADDGAVVEKSYKGKFALIRDTDGTEFSVVGDTYVPIQNSEAFSFFEAFCKSGQLSMETAGALKGGAHIWALAKTNMALTLPGGDVVNGYILFSSPHLIGEAMNLKFTAIRVVCNNTITMALRGFSNFRMPHVKAFDASVQSQAATALGLSSGLMDKFKEKAEFLSGKVASEEKVKEFITQVMDPDYFDETISAGKPMDFARANRPAKKVLEIIETQPGADLESSKGTWWGALNAVTFFADHKWGNNRDAAMHNAWFGPRASTKAAALDIAVEYAKAA